MHASRALPGALPHRPLGSTLLLLLKQPSPGAVQQPTPTNQSKRTPALPAHANLCPKDTPSMGSTTRLPASSSARTASAAIASTRPCAVSMPSTVTCSSLQRLLSGLLAISRERARFGRTHCSEVRHE